MPQEVARRRSGAGETSSVTYDAAAMALAVAGWADHMSPAALVFCCKRTANGASRRGGGTLPLGALAAGGPTDGA